MHRMLTTRHENTGTVKNPSMLSVHGPQLAHSSLILESGLHTRDIQACVAKAHKGIGAAFKVA